MKNSTISPKIKWFLEIAVGIGIWLAIWQIFAVRENNSFLFPDIPSTLSALGEIIRTGEFVKTVSSTLIRVLIGLGMGIAAGGVLAVLSHHLSFVKAFLAPILSVIKATPVASFIIILWIKMDGGELAIFIAFMMVMPIIWQNLIDGYNSIDRSLSEVCICYEFSFIKRLRVLVIPNLIRYLIPGIVTATGLAWKSEIAAEIIAYTRDSIGQNINDAKFNMDSPTVFAWTLIVIALSIALELIAKLILWRCKKWASN